jgi:hypothetical protein
MVKIGLILRVKDTYIEIRFLFSGEFLLLEETLDLFADVLLFLRGTIPE